MCRFVWTALLVLGVTACPGRPNPPEDEQPDAGEFVDAGDSSDAGDAGDTGDAGQPDGGGDAWTPPPSSHGSGKLPCQSTGTVTSNSKSYTYCVVQVAGTELKIVEPDPTTSTGPLRLAIYLHGDGARAHTGNTAPRLQAPWTFGHRALYVSALAPNRCAWWTKPTMTTCTDTATDADRDLEGKNAEVLVQIIETLRSKWDILDEPILFGGSSGGSVFLTASFLPKYGDQYRGAYALGCGGEAPWAGSLDWDSSDPALLGQSKLFYTYGDMDEYLADIQASVAYYQGISFPLAEKILPDTAHCAFDHVGGITQVWGTYLGE